MLAHALERLFDERLIGGAARFRGGDQDRHRLPRAGRVHRFDEAGNLRGHGRRRLRGLGEHRLAFEIARCAEIGLGRDRREGVAFEMDAEDGDAGTGIHGHFLLDPAPVWRLL